MLRPEGSPIAAVKSPHEEDHRVTEVLELAQLVEHDRVADVNVGRGRVEPELAAKGFARGLRARELLLELRFDQKGVRAAANERHRFADLVGNGVKLLSRLFLFFCHDVDAVEV